jgi:AraC family transcriptional regulator of adaptative response/methylated-DNA-[protein]-cysteine methyltransferase
VPRRKTNQTTETTVNSGLRAVRAELEAPRSRGASLYYMTHRTELGLSFLVAQDDEVIFHHVGDDEIGLLTSFKSVFPGLTPTPMTSRSLSDYSKWLDSLVSGTNPHRKISLSLGGTPFQQRVWKYLKTIPRGAQRSYSEVANAIGAPRATRAVASACARNQIALAIPCHRVIRSDGSLGGYRWGIERKRWLLGREARR